MYFLNNQFETIGNIDNSTDSDCLLIRQKIGPMPILIIGQSLRQTSSSIKFFNHSISMQNCEWEFTKTWCLQICCAISIQATSFWIPNENSFNTQTIGLHTILNGGKMWFWQAFFLLFFVVKWYKKGSIQQLKARPFIILVWKK